MCSRVLPLSAFYIKRDRRRKTEKRSGRCRECWKKQPSRSRERRAPENRARAERLGRVYRTRAEIDRASCARAAAKAAAREARNAAKVAFEHLFWVRATDQWRSLYLDARESVRRERVAALQRRRYARARESEIDRIRSYKRANAERNRRWSATRLRRERETGDLTRDEINRIREAARRCAYCGNGLTSRREIDHMDPIALGGAHSRENVVVVCAPCNLKKSALPFDEWLKRCPEPLLAQAAWVGMARQ